MADVLSEKARALITRPVLASLATLNPDGSPQITPLWVDLDGDDVVFNTAQGRKKARNLERDSRVAVTVIDPDDQYNVVAFQGTVTDVDDRGRRRAHRRPGQEVPGGGHLPHAPGGRGPRPRHGAHGPHRHAGLTPSRRPVNWPR